MSCCGQKRQAWREWNPKKTTSTDHQPPVIQNPTVLYHLGSSALVITGAVTDITYLFGGRNTSLHVDERDVPALIAMGQFTTSLSNDEPTTEVHALDN